MTVFVGRASRRPHARARAARWLLLPGVVFGSGSAEAEPPPAPWALAPVPEFRLSLPAAPVLPTAPALQRSERPWPQYWREPSGGKASRDFADSELRVRVETGRWELGRLSLTAAIQSVPERELECPPNCRGPDWHPSLILKYDAGDLGPLKQLGPSLDLGGALSPGLPARGASGGGFSGVF